MVISRKRHRTANKNGPPQASLIEVEDAGIATATARRRSLQRVVEHAQTAGRGRTALRYLAAYVKKSAFSEGRLLGYDQSGCIVLSYRDSADGKLKSEALDPLELIRRWLLHLLPKVLFACGTTDG